jgi:hypothetical protein
MKTYVLFRINQQVNSFPEDCEMVCCSTDLEKIKDKQDQLMEELLSGEEELDHYYDYYEVPNI